MNNNREILDLIAEAEQKLEDINQTMRFAMQYIDSSVDKNTEVGTYMVHLLGVMCDSVLNTNVMVEEIGSAVMHSIIRPA